MEQGTKTRSHAEKNGHWVTLHRLRFGAVIAATDRSFPAPDHPESWRFYPCQALTSDGLPSFASDVWCGFAIHDSRAQAEAISLTLPPICRNWPRRSNTGTHWPRPLPTTAASTGAGRFKPTVPFAQSTILAAAAALCL